MSLVITLADALFSGLKITLEVTFFSAILAFVVAFAAGIARLARQRWIRAMAATTWRFRKLQSWCKQRC